MHNIRERELAKRKNNRVSTIQNTHTHSLLTFGFDHVFIPNFLLFNKFTMVWKKLNWQVGKNYAGKKERHLLSWDCVWCWKRRLLVLFPESFLLEEKSPSGHWQLSLRLQWGNRRDVWSSSYFRITTLFAMEDVSNSSDWRQRMRFSESIMNRWTPCSPPDG